MEKGNGELTVRREQSELAGAGNRLGAAVDVQLAIDIAGVLLYRADGDDQLLRDRSVRIAGRDEVQDFQFAGGQWLDQNQSIIGRDSNDISLHAG